LQLLRCYHAQVLRDSIFSASSSLTPFFSLQQLLFCPLDSSIVRLDSLFVRLLLWRYETNRVDDYLVPVFERVVSVYGVA
jgi:hypothetical protein